jgi:hypothetical protein
VHSNDQAFRHMISAAVTGTTLHAHPTSPDATEAASLSSAVRGSEAQFQPGSETAWLSSAIRGSEAQFRGGQDWQGQRGMGRHRGNTVSGVLTSSTTHLHMRRSGSMASWGPARVTEQA